MKDIDTTKLTSKDVRALIDEIKEFADQINISIPLIGKFKLDKEVIGKST